MSETTGNNGDGNGEDKGQAADSSPTWAKTLEDSVRKLSGGIDNMLSVAEQRRAEEARLRNQPTNTDDDDPEPETDPAELETMSRKDFGNHLITSVLRAVNKQVTEPLVQQLNELRSSTTKQEIQGSVKELAASHKDFWDWRPEMLALAEENKGLPPHRLYQLARADNPDKAKELDTKYNPPKEDDPSRRRISFGGLTPGQSGTGSRARKMNGIEAANAAFAETVAALGSPDWGEE